MFTTIRIKNFDQPAIRIAPQGVNINKMGQSYLGDYVSFAEDVEERLLAIIPAEKGTANTLKLTRFQTSQCRVSDKNLLRRIWAMMGVEEEKCSYKVQGDWDGEKLVFDLKTYVKIAK